MPLGKRWNLAEETILAKAYLAATQNPFKGADQTAVAFQNDLFEKFKSFSPENFEDGRYYHRTGMAILEELRKLKADVQSFNKALNIVWASSPTGVTNEEKVAFSVFRSTKRVDTANSSFPSRTNSPNANIKRALPKSHFRTWENWPIEVTGLTFL